MIVRDRNLKLRVDKIPERLLTTEALLVVPTDSNGVETAKNELELDAETEGTLSSLSAIMLTICQQHGQLFALVATSLRL